MFWRLNFILIWSLRLPFGDLWSLFLREWRETETCEVRHSHRLTPFGHLHKTIIFNCCVWTFRVLVYMFIFCRTAARNNWRLLETFRDLAQFLFRGWIALESLQADAVTSAGTLPFGCVFVRLPCTCWCAVQRFFSSSKEPVQLIDAAFSRREMSSFNEPPCCHRI
jgi:hypothetical protein